MVRKKRNPEAIQKWHMKSNFELRGLNHCNRDECIHNAIWGYRPYSSIGGGGAVEPNRKNVLELYTKKKVHIYLRWMAAVTY